MATIQDEISQSNKALRNELKQNNIDLLNNVEIISTIFQTFILIFRVKNS